jgi:hypothetical protein
MTMVLCCVVLCCSQSVLETRTLDNGVLPNEMKITSTNESY